MRRLLERHEELLFTAAAALLLSAICAGYLAVRFAKESYAALNSGPQIEALYPCDVVGGAKQRVRVLAERSHFGPETVVEPQGDGVYVSAVGFASEGELWFDIQPELGAEVPEGSPIALTIRSPLRGGKSELIALELRLAHSPGPLALDLFSFGGEEEVTSSRDYVIFGYRPVGYAPFHFKARQLESGREWTQLTESESDLLGVDLERGENPFELTLSDALGRSVRRVVSVRFEAEELPADCLVSYVMAPPPGGYTGKPVQWSSAPTEQMAASDCVLGNGLLGCGAGGCGGGISAPPNDYVTTNGQTVTAGDGVELHSGRFALMHEVDLVIRGRGLDFIWTRSYKSGISLDGYLGRNWDFSYAAQFILDDPYSPQTGHFSRGDCRRDIYSGYSYQYGEYVSTIHPTGFYDIKCSVYSSQVTQIKRNGFKQTFDATTGLLKSREDRYGNKITLYYDYSGNLTYLKDTLNRYIYFYYGTSGASAGRLTKITDFASRSLEYEYGYVGSSVVLTKVKYPATDWLDESFSVQTNTPRTVEYAYDSSVRLTAVTDGRGKERLKNEYDANGRVTKQYNFDSGVGAPYHSFTYTLASGKVNVAAHTTRGGSDRRYFFDTSNHLSTRVEVDYGAGPATATTLITRDCACTLPTAIQEPDDGYTTWTIDGNGNVTEERKYHDDDPSGGYTTTAGYDIVRKAYYAPISSTMFGVMTKVVEPRGFAPGASEADYAIVVTYDTKANPITIEYPDTSNPTQTDVREIRTYNSYGQLLTIQGEEGMYTQLTYYSSGASNGYLSERRVKYSEAGSLTTSYAYNSFGAVTQLTDPRAKTTSYGVDSEGLITQVTGPSPSSYVTKYYYNGNRQLVKTEVENTQSETNTWWESQDIYDDAGLLATKRKEISQSGSVITWQENQYIYDDDFQLISILDPLEHVTEYELDERGLRTGVTYAKGTADEIWVTYNYDEDGRLGETVTFFTNPDSHTITKVSRNLYDQFDRVTKVCDTSSDATSNYKRIYYDLASHRITLDEYSAQGLDYLRSTKWEYDERGRLTKTKRGTGQEDIVTMEYDRAGRRIKVTDDAGTITETQYDYAGRATKTILPSINGLESGKNYVEVAYDASGNVTRKTSHEVITASSAEDFVWAMEYDELNRLVETTFYGSDGEAGVGGGEGPDPAQTIDAYDARGLVIRSTDVDGIETTHAYDGLGRRLSTTYDSGTGGLGVVVEAVYDAAGNVTTRIDGHRPSQSETGTATAYSYDAQNRLTEILYADGDWQRFTYNDLGRVKTRAYGNGASTALTLSRYYDLRGQLTTKAVSWTTMPTWEYMYTSYGTTQETFEYDGAGRLIGADDDDSQVSLGYNTLDQLTSEGLKIKTAGEWTVEKTTSYAYDWASGAGALTKVTYPVSGKEFKYEHDPLGRTTKIKLGGTPDKTMVKYSYRGPGQRVDNRHRGEDIDASGDKTYFGGAYSYDALGRLEGIHHVKIVYIADPPSFGYWTLREMDYTWGNGSTGRLFQRSTYDISDASSTLKEHTYTYDALGRLSTDTVDSAQKTYTFTSAQFYEEREGTSPEIAFTEAGDGSHQISSYSENGGASHSCSYDVLGNLVSDAGTGLGYGYDHENRLVFIDAATDQLFRYDALGRRISEKEGASETHFFYSGAHIVEETDASLNVARLSLFGVAIDEVLMSCSLSGGSLSAIRWPLADHLGSVVAVVDGTGAVKTSFDYTTAFGESLRIDTDEAYPYGFTGRRILRQESVTVGEDDYQLARLYDYRTRGYDGLLGRFLQRDAIGIWGDEGNMGNGFGYVRCNPINRVDPIGRQSAVSNPQSQLQEWSWYGYCGPGPDFMPWEERPPGEDDLSECCRIHDEDYEDIRTAGLIGVANPWQNEQALEADRRLCICATNAACETASCAIAKVGVVALFCANQARAIANNVGSGLAHMGEGIWLAGAGVVVAGRRVGSGFLEGGIAFARGNVVYGVERIGGGVVAGVENIVAGAGVGVANIAIGAVDVGAGVAEAGIAVAAGACAIGVAGAEGVIHGVEAAVVFFIDLF